MPHKDRAAKNAYHRAYSQKHKDVINARVVACNRKARLDRYAKIQTIKEASPCTDCGRSYASFVMDFDHRDPTQKVSDVSTLVKNCASWARVLDEIAKCHLVCVCCHRLRTYKGENSYRTRRYEHQRAALDELKASPCFDCGGSFKPCQMDFDHVEGGKVANIAQLVGGPTEGLLDEVAKCHLVCANCHRTRGATKGRPFAPEHSITLVMKLRWLLEATPQPKDKRRNAFSLPHLLGKVADKELAAQTGLSREMVAWHRRRAGILMTRQGEVRA